MRLLTTLGVLFISTLGWAVDEDCVALTPNSVEYDRVAKAMAGHLPRSFDELYYCGVAGWSKRFEAVLNAYEAHDVWQRSARMRCWQLSQTPPEGPFSCGPRFLSTNTETGLEVVSEKSIPLAILSQAVEALLPKLEADEQVRSLDYTEVKCGGAWSLAEYGFSVELAKKERETKRFQVLQECSPTPCVWNVRPLSSLRTSH